jgi:hypothetical protein
MLTTMDEHTFDDWDLDQLRARRAELVREERRLRVMELAVTRVLAERGALGPSDHCHRGVRC